MLFYPDLSYRIVGILFKIYNQLGNSLQEKYYQRAVEELLSKNGLRNQRELQCDLRIGEKKIGHYFLDFLVEGKIVLELKAKPYLKRQDFRQVQSYLKAKNLKLGILANFGKPEGLRFYRVLNPKYSESPV